MHPTSAGEVSYAIAVLTGSRSFTRNPHDLLGVLKQLSEALQVDHRAANWQHSILETLVLHRSATAVDFGEPSRQEVMEDAREVLVGVLDCVRRAPARKVG